MNTKPEMRIDQLRDKLTNAEEVAAQAIADCMGLRDLSAELLVALEAIIRNAGYESGQHEPTLRALSVDIPYLDAARAAIAKAKQA